MVLYEISRKLNRITAPILISNNGFAPIPRTIRPFRFQAAWLNHQVFHDFVLHNWKNEAPIVPFLKEFASQLSQWNREKFYNIFRKKFELWARINGIQALLSKGRQGHLIKLEAKLRREMDDVLHDEETLWFQKSRMEAINDGDRNTRFFHLSTVIRRHRNRIDMLQDGSGQWISDPSAVKEMVMTYWSNLFQEEGCGESRNVLPRDCFPNITNEDYEKMNRPLSECKVWLAVKSMKPF